MPGTAQPNVGLSQGWNDNENGWGAAMNANLRSLDLLVQARVIDKDLATPPGSPAAGDAYIVAASPTGAWAGSAAKVARWSGTAWEFYTPKAGWVCWVADEAKAYRHNGTAWAAWAAAISEVSGLQAALDAKADSMVAINTQTGSYTLVLADAGKLIRCTSGTSAGVTVPLNSSVAFPVGTVISIRQAGAGEIGILGSPTINVPTGYIATCGRQGATVMLHKVGADEWDITGDLKAA